MKIFDKLQELKGKMSCCNGTSACSSSRADGEQGCKVTAFVCCFAKKLPAVALCLAILLPPVAYFFGPKYIRWYLLKHPESIIESVQKFSEKRQKEMQEASAGKISEIYDKLTKDTKVPFLGNKNGSHVVIVFYDYACGYCKKAANELKKLTSKDKELKVVLQDLPLFGANSIDAAKASMFVFEKHNSKFEEFHHKLISSKDINAQTINSVAKSVGIGEDVVKASKSMYEEALRTNYEMAGEARVDGTPAMIINGKLHSGFRSEEDIEKLLK